ncbi:hypothetical protein RJT34_06742 [Clitoria ternatea]|uniref:Uncharacterized protein n=1 Tax=Clitoria ternatea TaxID=43366 RepID=A0AAN9K5X4_CLITE
MIPFLLHALCFPPPLSSSSNALLLGLGSYFVAKLPSSVMVASVISDNSLQIKQLAKMATPSYTKDGELIDGGFVQIMFTISGNFWYTYLVLVSYLVLLNLNGFLVVAFVLSLHNAEWGEFAIWLDDSL